MKTEVLIVGAGYYGLSVACYLADRNVPFVVVGKTFSLWFDHILEEMSLRSGIPETEMFVSGNPYKLSSFIRKNYSNPDKILSKELSIKVFRDYLNFVKKDLKFKVKDNYVAKLENNNDGFKARLDNGESVESKFVVIATGMGPHKYLPHSLDNLNVLHSWNVDKYRNLKNKSILVVGSGQSAAETIAHLRKDNKIIWVTRNEPTFYKDPVKVPPFMFKLLIHTSPFLYFFSRKLRKIIPKNTYHATITPNLEKDLFNYDVRLLHADVDKLKLQKKGASFVSSKYGLKVDYVISSTGYKYSFNNLKFLSNDLKIKLSRSLVDFNFESGVKNLFVVGGITEPVHGIAQRFLFGARHSAKRVSKAISKRMNS